MVNRRAILRMTWRSDGVLSAKAPRSPRTRGILSVALCVCLVQSITGCASWKPGNTPRPELNTDGEQIGHVLLTMKTGEELELWEAHVQSDSLVGYTTDVRKYRSIHGLRGGYDPALVDEHYLATVMLADVESVKVRKTSGAKTATLIVAILVGALAGIVALVGASLSSHPISG